MASFDETDDLESLHSAFWFGLQTEMALWPWWMTSVVRWRELDSIHPLWPITSFWSVKHRIFLDYLPESGDEGTTLYCIHFLIYCKICSTLWGISCMLLLHAMLFSNSVRLWFEKNMLITSFPPFALIKGWQWTPWKGVWIPLSYKMWLCGGWYHKFYIGICLWPQHCSWISWLFLCLRASLQQ